MTRIELNLADDLAREAEAAGLLDRLRLEALIRTELAASRRGDFFTLSERLRAVPGEPMPMDEIVELVKDVRRERNARKAKAEPHS